MRPRGLGAWLTFAERSPRKEARHAVQQKHQATAKPTQPNDTAFSGERKRVRCNAWLGGTAGTGGWLQGLQYAAEEDSGRERYRDREDATYSDGGNEKDGEET
jgi:hypothetical protein